MKKILLLLIVFCAAQFASAQFLQVESCSTRLGKHRVEHMFKKDEYYDRYYSTVRLSNGDVLSIVTDAYSPKWWWHFAELGKSSIKCECNLDPKVNYPKGTLVYKYQYGNTVGYELVTMKKIGVYTIKSCKVREINVEMNAQADYSQKSFYVFMVGGKSSASGSYRAHGGLKTVVNVIFTNGQTASIVAADDPIWLEAKPGQKVEHYRVRDVNIYKLVF